MASSIFGTTLRGKTRILAAPSGGLEPAVLPISGASGPSTQTLTQSARYDNSQTFYAHTLTVGSVTLTASRYDNAQTFYTHVVSQSAPAQNLSQTSRYDNLQTYYTHTLTVGAVTLTPDRFDNSQTFYSHTLTPGAVTLSPIRFDNAQTFYAHSVTVGAVTLNQSSRFDNAQTFYTHEITNAGGVQSLTQSARFDNAQTFYTHTVTQGPATQYLVARDHVETGWVEPGWVGWPYFNTQTFYPASIEVEPLSGQSFIGGRGFTGWDGKIYHSSDMVSIKPSKRIYFNESQARIVKKVENVVSEMRNGVSGNVYDKAADTIMDIRIEIANLQASEAVLNASSKETELLKVQMEIANMEALIEEIDVAFITFTIVGD